MTVTCPLGAAMIRAGVPSNNTWVLESVVGYAPPVGVAPTTVDGPKFEPYIATSSPGETPPTNPLAAFATAAITGVGAVVTTRLTVTVAGVAPFWLVLEMVTVPV